MTRALISGDRRYFCDHDCLVANEQCVNVRAHCGLQVTAYASQSTLNRCRIPDSDDRKIVFLVHSEDDRPALSICEGADSLPNGRGQSTLRFLNLAGGVIGTDSA
jgi:hypothetical protein